MKLRKKTRRKLLWGVSILSVLIFLGYSIIGTSTNVEQIKKLAPAEIAKRNWKILRYEGFQYGSWNTNGGKVWYHVANIDNPNIQYRIYITMWNNELQYCYGEPEILSRVQLQYPTK